MTLDELIERLEEIRDEVGGDATVRGVLQPNYPLIARIDAITTIIDSGKEDGVFIGLAEAREYGCSEHYADDFVSIDQDDDDE
jgi:hypothetical protein